MNVSDVVEFRIEEKDIIAALDKSLSADFMDNLRDRSQFVKLDSKIRGYLGEALILRILNDNGIRVTGVGLSEEDNTDIDIEINNTNHCDLKMEVKTSLIPDNWRTMDNVIDKGDIKIIKRENYYKDIKSDFHVQVYFNLMTKERDTFLSSIPNPITDYSRSELITVMKLDELKHYFVAWIDKNTLIKHLEKLRYKYWRFSYRYFWKCDLKNSRPFSELIEGINTYKRNY